MLIVVVVIFAVCWLPQHVYFLVTNFYFSEGTHFQHIYLVIYWVAMSNSMYNPIMYCWMNARYVNIKWSPRGVLSEFSQSDISCIVILMHSGILVKLSDRSTDRPTDRPSSCLAD